MSDSASTARRNPRQTRSRATVEAILEAATRILEAGEVFTTNHVADRAGVSVGTLYQYFPGKTAILHALGAREREAIAEATRKAFAEGVEPARAAIRAQLAAFDGRHAARRVVLETILRDPPVPGMADAVDKGVAPFIGEGARSIHAFVISRAVMGVVRAAVLEHSPVLGTPDLEEALVRLVRGYAEAAPKRSK